MPKRRGVDGRLWIGSVTNPSEGMWVGYQRIEVNDKTTVLPVTDSELVPGNPDYAGLDDTVSSQLADRFVAKIGDLREGVIRFVNATWSEENNPFGPPLRIHSGQFYYLRLHAVRGQNTTNHELGNCVCANAGHTLMIPGAQPVNLDFETDGSFRMPGELEGL